MKIISIAGLRQQLGLALGLFAALTLSPAIASDRNGFVVEPEFSRVSFDNGLLSGSTHSLGLNIAYAFRSHFEIGYNYSSNQLFPLPLMNVTSLDQDSGVMEEDDLEVSSGQLYARLNWHLSEDTSAFFIIGESDYELKSEEVTVDTFFFIPVSLSTRTTYRSKNSSTSMGVGLQWRHQHNQFFTLKYIDHSSGDFDFSTLHLGLRWVLHSSS